MNWNKEAAAAIIAAHADMPGATLPVLNALQSAFGYVPDEAIAMVAQTLNLSRAEVHGVVSFYHDYRSAPPGRHILQVCGAEACQAMGGEALAERLRARVGIAWGETAADGSVTLERVYCLGLCACAPALLRDGAPEGRLNAARVDTILNDTVR